MPAGRDFDFSIPKSVFRRIVKSMLTEDKHVSTDALLLLQEHCEDLALTIFTRANLMAGKDGRVTLKKEDMAAVLSEIDFTCDHSS